MQLAQKVALHDVADVEAFVRATISRGRVRLTIDEREELVAEGLRIMCALDKAYEPGRNGLDASQSKFSGFAAKYLPGKLSDAWHRMQEHHLLVTQPDGSRKWTYKERRESLEAVLEADEQRTRREEITEEVTAYARRYRASRTIDDVFDVTYEQAGVYG